MRYFRLLAYGPYLSTGDSWDIEFAPIVRNLLLGYESLADWDESLVGTYQGDFLGPQFMFSLNYKPLFSKELRELLEPIVKDSVQFLPFRMKQDGGDGIVTGYTIGHILRRIECIDRSQTKVRHDDWTPRANGTFRVIPPLSLKREEIKLSNFFVVKESPVNIIVREDVKEVFESVTGCEARFEEMAVSG